jgi:hypothetical protein
MVTRDSAFDTDGTANDGAVIWQHALDYIKKLNSEHHLNHTDWRLPNTRELRSLADYSQYDEPFPTGHPFTNVQSYSYWSSTSYADVTHYECAWVENMYYGSVSCYSKAYFYNYVWPVRAGQCGSFDNSTTTTTVGSTTTIPTTTTVLSTTTSIISSTTTSSGGGLTTTTSVSSGNTTTTTLPLEAPVANPDNYTTLKNETLIIAASDGLLANDSGSNLTANMASMPLHGDLALNSDGSFIYIPTKDFVGTDNFTYIATDGIQNSLPAKVSIVVNKKCPATKVLGSDNPNLENLRDFRDSKLANSAVGRRIIQIYYNNADSINAALERSPVLRAASRRVLEVIAPMVGRKEE